MKARTLLAATALLFSFSCGTETAQENTQNINLPAPQPSEATAVKTANRPEDPAAETAQTGNAPEMTFAQVKHDFGNLKVGEAVTHVFKFSNTGTAPLVISDIRTSCGCTTPQYTRDPVAPGQEGEITVRFDSAGKSGKQIKNITVFTNTPAKQSILTIECNIAEELAGPFKVQ